MNVCPLDDRPELVLEVPSRSLVFLIVRDVLEIAESSNKRTDPRLQISWNHYFRIEQHFVIACILAIVPDRVGRLSVRDRWGFLAKIKNESDFNLAIRTGKLVFLDSRVTYSRAGDHPRSTGDTLESFSVDHASAKKAELLSYIAKEMQLGRQTFQTSDIC